MNLSNLNLNTPQWTRKLLVLTLVLSLLLIVWSLGPYLWDKYRVTLDTQNFYWLARAQDPTLFSIDYLYISSWMIIEADILGFHILFYPLSFGYGLFFYLASTVIDYVWLAKWSILISGPLCVIYLFKIGQFSRNNLTGMSLALIFIFFILASPRSQTIATGLQRAFAMPLLIAFFYYLIRQHYIGAAVSIFICVLVYLPVFPLMVITYTLSFLDIKSRSKLSLNFSWAKLTPLIVTLFLSGMFVVLALAAQRDLLPSSIATDSTPGFEALDSVQKTSPSAAAVNTNSSTHQSEGPTPLFFSFPFLGRAGLFDTGGDVINVLVMLILAVLIFKIVGSQSLSRIPVEIWYFLIAGFIMYGLALFFLLKLSSFVLYLPSRYTRNALFLTLVFFTGLNWIDFLHEFPSWLWKNRRLIIFSFVSFGLMLAAVYIFSSNRMGLIPIFWAIGLILSGILALLGGSSLFWLVTVNLSLSHVARGSILIIVGVIVAYLGTTYINTLGIKTTNPSESERDIYEFVASLPKDAMFAGDPSIMTHIPLFSKRSVLFRELFPKGGPHIPDYFDAQYAESPQVVWEFCQRYRVDYLVIDTRDLSPDYLAKEKFFFQPWNDEIVKMVAGRSDFIVPRIQPVFTSGPFRVIKCDPEILLVDHESK